MSAPDTRTLARTLGGSTGLTDRWASHPFVRVDLPEWDVRAVWQDEDVCVLAVAAPAGPVPGGPDDAAHPEQPVALWGVGSPEATATRLAGLAASGDLPGRVVRLGLPRGTLDLLGRAATGAGLPAILRDRAGEHAASTWDFLATCEAPPVQPGEEHVEALTGPGAAAEARECLDRANPLAEMSPEDPLTRWWGWRDPDGVLRGVVGARQAAPGVPWSLGSIATDPSWRGHGIAAATTAVVTRAGLAEADWVTLGMYADNDPARRLYTKLGFAVAQEFESRR
ncbi:GNAT family N-acetyltransferase [Oerskovia turbata]